ncbi:hypothetical protein [Corynebacterium sputi]|uniref:hypothetical protein n=1 Tax=Corynebacterium sputi TaxID=489915 RepID=UPI000406E0B3|nr:hypothetical protein [Corynebacterium sputi]
MEAVPDLSGMSRDAAVSVLRKSISRITNAAPEATDGAAGRVSEMFTDGRRLPVPEELSDVLGGTLLRGAVTELDRPGLLMSAIIAAITAEGGHVAVIGLSEFLPATVVERGGDLSRLFLVPDPGENPLEIIGTAADGVDLVVAACNRDTSPSLARPVAARLRRASAALVSVGGAWPGAVGKLSSTLVEVHGLGHGNGRIRDVDLQVRAVVQSRSGAPERSARWRVGTENASVVETPAVRMRAVR